MTSGVLEPAVIRFLAGIVERHCATHGIHSLEGRESVATSALSYFESGVTTEDALLAVLAQEDDPDLILLREPNLPDTVEAAAA